MKKVIFIILIMFPFLVYADCDYEKFNEHTKLANNITYEVNYYTGEKKFGVVLYNVYDGIYVTYNNSIYNADDENIVFIGNIPQGEFVKISVYSPVEECNSFIRTINVSVGYYNNYYDDPRCSKYKDILNICSNKYLEYEPNEDLLESTIKNYKSTFKEEKKTEKNEEEVTLFDIIYNFFSVWGIPIILMIVVSIITITFFKARFRKIQHGI